MSKVYTVRLVRPVFQSVEIEVQAMSTNSAMQKAQRQAAALPASGWSEQEFEDGLHSVHVESVLENQKVEETSSNPDRDIKDFRSGDRNSNQYGYLILAADLSARVGRVLPQPWFSCIDHVLQAELCSDWVEPISFILENDGLSEDAQIAIGWKTSTKDNVIDFPISELDQELVESSS